MNGWVGGWVEEGGGGGGGGRGMLFWREWVDGWVGWVGGGVGEGRGMVGEEETRSSTLTNSMKRPSRGERLSAATIR